MKAVLLIGGQGTRLRPFTLKTPKPLLPILNRPFLHYQFQQLKSHGIREVLLCTSYKPEEFRRALGDGKRLGLRIRYVHETTPLGTGGALRNAEAFLDETTLVLNGDVLNTFELDAMRRSHEKNKADVTLALIRVQDPTSYGLVETDRQDRVLRFLEKPSWDEITANTINAGAYLFEPTVVSLIPKGVPYSLERGLFPYLLETGHRLFGFVAKGYWLDIGTVEKYLQAHLDILGGRTPFRPSGTRRKAAGQLARRALWVEPGVKLGPSISHNGHEGAVSLGRGVRIGPFVRFSGSVSVGPRCVVGKGASLENCVVLEGTRVGEGSRLEGCVVGRRCRIGPNSRVGPGRALGDGSVLQNFSQL